MSTTPHDTLVKAILGRPEYAAAALRSIVPTALVGALDWSALRQEDAEFVRVEGGTRCSDLLFAVPFLAEGVTSEEPPREALVYVLLEHQSTPDSLMALRLFVYVARLFEKRVLRADAARVPLVVPVVLAHGERPWSEALSLEALYDAPPTLIDALGPLVPRLTYALEDLTPLSDEVLAARVADSVVRLTWTVLRDARTSSDLSAYALHLRDLLRVVRRRDCPAFASLFEYIMRTKEYDQATARAVVAMVQSEAQEEESMVSAYDGLLAESEARGEAKGEARGEAKGRRLTLAKQLQLKFGALSDEVRARLDGADEASLDEFAERILFATTVEGVFGG